MASGRVCLDYAGSDAHQPDVQRGPAVHARRGLVAAEPRALRHARNGNRDARKIARTWPAVDLSPGLRPKGMSRPREAAPSGSLTELRRATGHASSDILNGQQSRTDSVASRPRMKASGVPPAPPPTSYRSSSTPCSPTRGRAHRCCLAISRMRAFTRSCTRPPADRACICRWPRLGAWWRHTDQPEPARLRRAAPRDTGEYERNRDRAAEEMPE